MDDRTKWLEWLKADPLTALTCYEGAGLDWSEAWKEHIKMFLPDSKDPLDLQAFDFQYQEEVAEFGNYCVRLCGNYWLRICYILDDVTLYRSTDDEYWKNNDILLSFDRPDSVYPHEIIATAMREIEPYIYHLLFPRTVQTTEDEA